MQQIYTLYASHHDPHETLLLFQLAHAISAHPTSRTLSVTSSSKAGIAGGGDAQTDMTQFTVTGRVSWYYTWSLYSVDTDLEFVPMLWGQKDVTQWTDASDGINATISQRKPTAILGMNEPQEPAQADMWKTYIEPFHAQGLRLRAVGKTWLQDFLTACDGGCTVDVIALHYYDVNATKFAEYLTDFHDTFQRPIWNFNKGPQCTAPEVAEFLNQTQAFMDAQDWVERYAWYGVMRDLGGVNTDDAMMNSNGQITDLGKQYIGAEAPKTSGAPPSGTGTAGLPGIPTNAGMLVRWWTSWGLIPIFMVACLL
ncbi:glycosyl hydrolase catalytic core-domain-containing protein [Mycena leptocephala]|nr:glycosyl hydrolase catalytic core-domain-containing protein [Mycena leptocephala]